MKKMDSYGLKICGYQAGLFEYAAERTECSSPVFIRRFMNSGLAKRMDSTGFMYDSTDFADAMSEIESQYGESTYGIRKYSAEEMRWIGYIYRYWAYISGLSSKRLYKAVKPEKLRMLYFPYHSLDPYQVIERITEETDFPQKDSLAEGVRILRKIRSKPRQSK